ncbi:hypothetical protein TraAM80_02712 [Trypanosoma rangeli]|uniref:Uncharacterized protein n=1 Tax=Trypanosoma rangeli TaxID=5698 RepID=A0A3R7NM47_TRYRA|nr:uncharacterized protein TraAM80_02712 [Trypanosoma rangeli]RNF08487.1 hypothetical protein TraAM80_02712 [Trypanosoma rangeli]|eukprot:RNF08487.1 hypothetical protein TraAM80_02712 [Trypanosoma rangeli]
MCQARVQYVLGRNFSYFSLFRLTQGVDSVRLAWNKVLFCRFDSVQWRELRRNFPHLLNGADAVALIEKVPSQTASFLRLVRQRQLRWPSQGRTRGVNSVNNKKAAVTCLRRTIFCLLLPHLLLSLRGRAN